MKYVVIGESSGATMDQVMKVYPRHKSLVDQFIARGEVIGIGPFADRGNMAIFRTCGRAGIYRSGSVRARRPRQVLHHPRMERRPDR